MNGKIVQILRDSVANTWKKKGSLCYRSLLIDDSKESEEAVRFMEELGLAYKLEYAGGIRNSEGVKLPALVLAHSKVFQGLDEIKNYGRTAFVPNGDEACKEDETKDELSKALMNRPLPAVDYASK